MKEVDIVIISWAKDPALKQVTQTGLDTLFVSTESLQFNVIVVESNKEVSWDYAPAPHTIKTIHPEEEFGYHKFLNIGRKAGQAPYVALCNSDLSYEKDWAEKIISAIETFPTIFSASPWCPQTQGDNTPHKNNIYSGYRVRGELAGWCIFQKREIYQKMGDLDERFTFWYCDNSYSIELQKYKIHHVLVPDSVVNHHEKNLGKTGETLDISEQKRITTEQHKIFTEVYGEI
jgi:GT2 family glycosyltransferase